LADAGFGTKAKTSATAKVSKIFKMAGFIISASSTRRQRTGSARYSFTVLKIVETISMSDIPAMAMIPPTSKIR
jgi:hypothetical protein